MKNVNEDIAKIDAPGIRILLYILIASTTTLFSLLVIKSNSDEKSLKSSYNMSEVKCDSLKNQYEQRLESKQLEIDKLKQDIIKSRDETIEYLKKFTKNQETINENLTRLK